MQNPPVFKGTGLEPLAEKKTEEGKVVHVFGKNLEERVTNDEGQESPFLSFGTFLTNNDTNDSEPIRKRKFDAITGEEDEETVFQGEFKLFQWDASSSNWKEKGRGQLKLNDSANDGKQEKKSRLIMRISGTLKIVLNVSVKSPNFRVLVCTKNNIRFTDSQTVWAASGSNTQNLKELIEKRLESSKMIGNGGDDKNITCGRTTVAATKTELDSQLSSDSHESPAAAAAATISKDNESEKSGTDKDDRSSSRLSEARAEATSPTKTTTTTTSASAAATPIGDTTDGARAEAVKKSSGQSEKLDGQSDSEHSGELATSGEQQPASTNNTKRPDEEEQSATESSPAEEEGQDSQEEEEEEEEPSVGEQSDEGEPSGAGSGPTDRRKAEQAAADEGIPKEPPTVAASEDSPKT